MGWVFVQISTCYIADLDRMVAKSCVGKRENGLGARKIRRAMSSAAKSQTYGIDRKSMQLGRQEESVLISRPLVPSLSRSKRLRLLQMVRYRDDDDRLVLTPSSAVNYGAEVCLRFPRTSLCNSA